jgi:hypothetical protein
MSKKSQSASRTVEGQFAAGNPGGPGRPRKVVKAAADALDERVARVADELLDVTLQQANGGNLMAVKMLLDRVWPVGRSRPLEIAVPQINGARDLLPAMAGITNAMFGGDATAAEGVAAAKVLKAHLEAIRTIDHEDRLTVLENDEPGAKHGGAGFQR